MDFTLTKEQMDIREAAKTFAQGEFDADLVSERDKRAQFPHETFQKACDLGFIGMHIPEQHGGPGLGNLESALVFEAFCREDSSMGSALALSDLGSQAVLKYGSETQIKRFVSSICSGESVFSPACLEEGYDDPGNAIHTRATEKNDGYLIHGAKTFVFHTTLPGPIIIPCRLGRESEPVEDAIFLVEKDADGLFYSDMGDRVGMRLVPMGNVTMGDLMLSPGHRIGDGEDSGSPLDLILMEMHGRAAAIGTGIAQGAFDRALAYARRREQFRRKIAAFEAVRGRLTDMATRIELSRLLTYNVCWSFDREQGSPRLCNMAKVVASETALEVSRDGLHIFGGYGYIVDYHIERFYRDASMVDIIGLPGYTVKKRLHGDVVGRV